MSKERVMPAHDPGGTVDIELCQAILRDLDEQPKEDRAWVYEHISAHLRDADIEPMEFTSSHDDGEVRVQRAFEIQEFRAVDEGDGMKFRGYAAVFDSVADIGWFDEKIERGAFTDTIKDDDIRALWNHNPDFPLARSRPGESNNTLTLKEDSRGLYIEIDPPDTTYANDLKESMTRGDVTQMSFGFWVIDQRSEVVDGKELRILTKIRLFDVSAVTYPAYDDTEIYVRSAFNKENVDPEMLAERVKRDLTKEQFDKFSEIILTLHGNVRDSGEPTPSDSDADSANDSDEGDIDPTEAYELSGKTRKRKLELLKKTN